MLCIGKIFLLLFKHSNTPLKFFLSLSAFVKLSLLLTDTLIMLAL